MVGLPHLVRRWRKKDSVSVIAILATYNEERFIAGCLEHLIGQGVEVHLIDNASTDRTVEIAERYLKRGVVGIENLPRQGVFDLQVQLERKEQLAATLEADWFIHVDTDEIRLPPRSNRTLAQAFAEVEARGYNAVNFLEFAFVPTREAPDHDHPHFQRTMRWYYPFAPVFPHRLNAWKRQPKKVDLAHWAGHRVRFSGLRMYPESFKMRHYLFLSAPHLLEKYGTRGHSAAEVQKGWQGWRSRLVAERIELPSQKALRTYSSDDELDGSDPSTHHVCEAWAVPQENK